MNPEIKNRLIETLESEKPFKEFTRQFRNLNEAYSFYAEYAQEKWRYRNGKSRESYYVLHWQKIYADTDSYLNFIVQMGFGKLSAKYRELNFTTLHKLEEKVVRQLQIHRIVRELMNAIVLFLAIPTGGLALVAVGFIVSAITGSGKPPANLLHGIIMLIVAIVLILLATVIKQKSLTQGMPAAIKHVGRGVFELRKISNVSI